MHSNIVKQKKPNTQKMANYTKKKNEKNIQHNADNYI